MEIFSKQKRRAYQNKGKSDQDSVEHDGNHEVEGVWYEVDAPRRYGQEQEGGQSEDQNDFAEKVLLQIRGSK